MAGLFVSNLGCKVNRVESDSILARAQQAGWVAGCIEEADCIIVNTCTLTGEAQKKTRKAIHQALKANHEARIVVTGCAAAINPDELAALDPRVCIVSKRALSGYVAGLLSERGLEPVVPSTPACLLRVGELFPTRVGIKVQDGCSHACTYCIVHTARGPVWSKPADEVVCEARRYAEAGIRELVFAGINLGSYQDAEIGIAELLSSVLASTEGLDDDGIPRLRVRLSSIEPRDVTDALIALLAEADGRVCRHLHIPLQAGSSKVLREMARPYDAGYFADLVEKLYACIPQLSLSTDIIVGFPGESDDDFRQTMELARRCRFSKIHVFPYSRREGTPAALRTDQIDPETKRSRAHALRTLSDSLRLKDALRRAGGEELVIIERSGRALTESYHELAVDAGIPVGTMKRARIADGSCMIL